MKDTFFITTAIPYMNAAPHVGHAYELVLTDILARYQRGRRHAVLFLTGSDEHGTKIVRAAQKAGKSPKVFVDEYATMYQDLWRRLYISYDVFIRTSDRATHWAGATELWNAIAKSGDVYKGTYRGLYCVGCEAFVTPKELVDGKCQYHGVPPEAVEEENYFFKLSKYFSQIREAIEKKEFRIIPENRTAEILEMLSGEVEDISFSRPEGAIPWGVPVPGDPTQMMYVWSDALANYLSGVGYGSDQDRFAAHWPADVQVIGKDIVRFHAVIWPAMLLSAKLPLPKTLLVHGFITSGGKKMSKTVGNIIDPYEYVDRYGAEAFRFYLAHDISSVEDGDFTLEKFISSYNGNLANGIGNLVSRVLKMADQYFGGVIKRAPESDPPIHTVFETVGTITKREGDTIPHIVQTQILPAYTKAMEQFEVHRAMEAALRLVSILDAYIADYEPYKKIKTDRAQAEQVIGNVLYGLSFLATMLAPVIPKTADTLRGLVGALEQDDPRQFKTGVLAAPLFPRIVE